MALTVVDTATKNAILDTYTARINSGSTNPTAAIKFYTAGQATLLGTVLLANPPFPAAAGGSMTASPTTRDEAADATGTAAIAVFVNRSDTAIITGTVTDEAGNGDVRLKTTAVVVGQPFEISSIAFTHP